MNEPQENPSQPAHNPQVPSPPPSMQQPQQNAPVQPITPPGQPGAQPTMPQGHWQGGNQTQAYSPQAQQQGQAYQPYQYQAAPPPYPPYQNHPYQQPEKKGRVWPWVLGGCLIFAILGLGGCVGCIACSALFADDGYDYRYEYPYDYGNDYDFGYDGGLYDGLDMDSSSFTYSLADIEGLAEGLPSLVEEGICSTGLFEVGPGKDIAAGLYYLEGAQDEEGSFMVFKEDGLGGYTADTSVYYFGNYFAELAEGDIIVFLGPASKHMQPAQETAYETGDPIESGCYRVGIDIPAGSYRVSYQKGSPKDASQEAGVYVMNDLAWSDDSIPEYHYLIAGGSHTVTVTEGQYVELYKTTMVAEGSDLAATPETATP